MRNPPVAGDDDASMNIPPPAEAAGAPLAAGAGHGRARKNRFNQLLKGDGEESKRILTAAQNDVDQRWKMYQHMAAMK